MKWFPWSRKWMAVVEYEVYASGKPVKWGNFTVTYTRRTVDTLMEDIRNAAAQSTGMQADYVRVVGVWRIL